VTADFALARSITQSLAGTTALRNSRPKDPRRERHPDRR